MAKKVDFQFIFWYNYIAVPKLTPSECKEGIVMLSRKSAMIAVSTRNDLMARFTDDITQVCEGWWPENSDAGDGQLTLHYEVNDKDFAMIEVETHAQITDPDHEPFKDYLCLEVYDKAPDRMFQPTCLTRMLFWRK